MAHARARTARAHQDHVTTKSRPSHDHVTTPSHDPKSRVTARETFPQGRQGDPSMIPVPLAGAMETVWRYPVCRRRGVQGVSRARDPSWLASLGKTGKLRASGMAGIEPTPPASERLDTALAPAQLLISMLRFQAADRLRAARTMGDVMAVTACARPGRWRM